MIDVKITKNEAQKKLLSSLEKGQVLKKAEGALEKFVGPFTLYLVDKKTALSDDALAEKIFKTRSRKGLKRPPVKIIKASVEKAAKSKKGEAFSWPIKNYGFSCPLKHDNDVFGYVIGYRLNIKPTEAMLGFFTTFIDTLLNGMTKEIELEELRKTIKPRDIALSTVHTLHRLISGSPYLDDLLSRIARLSMQIISANRCSVKLVDSKRKTLLPKATVDLRKKKTHLKKVKIGRWAPGKAVKYGKSIKANGYLATPLIDEDVVGVITLYDKTDNQPFSNFDVEIMKTLAEQAAIAIKNAMLYKEQEKLTLGSINALAQIIESKSAGIYKPKPSFMRIALLIGQEFGIREHELKTLQYAALLHDAGELMLPERLLRKRGKLTREEYKLIKEHPLKGAKIIKSLKSLKSIAPIIMYHHENYDGTGYPKGLKGAEIPIGARIMGVVAAFEAMITKRPYRVSRPIPIAIDEIKRNSGKQFDPKVVKAFLKVIKRKDVLKQLKGER